MSADATGSVDAEFRAGARRQRATGPDEPVFDADGTPVDALPDTPVPTHLSKRYVGDIPVIFGHYWFEAPLELTNPLAFCVDYSAGAGGPLAAYRFDGEPTLRPDHLVSC